MRITDLGCPIFHPEALYWRKPRIDEIKSGELIGKRFRTTRGKEFICENINNNYIYFHTIQMDIKYCKFLLPTIRQLTTKEQIQWLYANYDIKSFNIDQGCQLHGDKDAHLYLKDGTYYRLAWNY